jgi:hypothetical protein
MAALPFVFLTNELHIISPGTLKNGQPPSTIQITKHFLKLHVEDMKQEFFAVKAMGSATAEEWLKGLDNRGKERKTDATRWERWEANGGVTRMCTTELHERRKKQIQNGSLLPVTTDLDSAQSASTTNGNIPVFQGHGESHQETPFPTQQNQLPQANHNSFRKRFLITP